MSQEQDEGQRARQAIIDGLVLPNTAPKFVVSEITKSIIGFAVFKLCDAGLGKAKNYFSKPKE